MVVKKMVVKKLTNIEKKVVAKKRVGHIPTGCHWALVWPRSKSPEMAWNGASELLFGLGVNGTDFFLSCSKFSIEWCFHTTFAKKKVLL